MVLEFKMSIKKSEMTKLVTRAIEDRGKFGLGERQGYPEITVHIDNTEIQVEYVTCGGASLWATLEWDDEEESWTGLGVYSGSRTAWETSWDYEWNTFAEVIKKYSSEHGGSSYEEGVNGANDFVATLCRQAVQKISN